MAEPKKPEKAARPERVEIGFEGGQVVAARLDPDQLVTLKKALQEGEGWVSLDSEDGELSVDVDEVVFIRLATGEHKIGFGGG